MSDKVVGELKIILDNLKTNDEVEELKAILDQLKEPINRSADLLGDSLKGRQSIYFYLIQRKVECYIIFLALYPIFRLLVCDQCLFCMGCSPSVLLNY